MRFNHRRFLPSTLICCSMLMMLLLSACGTSGPTTGTTGGASMPAATPTPSPTPTPAPPALATYNGNGYTISYPKDWVQKQETKQIGGQSIPVTLFSGESSTFAVGEIPDPNGMVTSQSVTSGALQAAGFVPTIKNYKALSVPSQATAGGQTWDQAAASGDIDQSWYSGSAEGYALACTYPTSSSSTKLYVILYGGPSSSFDAANKDIYQPMLQSFKFS